MLSLDCYPADYSPRYTGGTVSVPAEDIMKQSILNDIDRALGTPTMTNMIPAALSDRDTR